MQSAHARTRFIPQEGLIDWVLFGFDWWSDKLASYLEHACDYYPGLAYVRDTVVPHDFTWPTVEAEPTTGPGGDDSNDRADETILHELGYNVAKDGPSREERWRLLQTIIDGKAMPLRDVVGTIASHCRSRRRQRGGEEKFGRALGEWEYDLARLKSKYYSSGRYAWSWPSVTRDRS